PRAADHLGATALSHARLAVARGADPALLERLQAAGAADPAGPPAGTPSLSVALDGRRLFRLDGVVRVYDSGGYAEGPEPLLPYTAECRSHGCLVPPVAILPAGTTVELLYRRSGGEDARRGVFLVQADGLEGLLFSAEDYGAWAPAGAAASAVTIGRVAYIRDAQWVEAFGVDLSEATGGLIW
ncbi:hypothetical protein, partial [Halorhodospira neutriphila]